MGEHLAHGVTVHTEDTGSLPDAHAVYHAGSSDTQIHLHLVHPSHLPQGRVVPYERWRTVQFSTAVCRRSSRPLGTLLLRRLQVELVPINGHKANGNGHHDEAEEPQQSLFSWAEFMADAPVKSKARRSKPQPATISMFEWALEQEREAEPVGAGP